MEHPLLDWHDVFTLLSLGFTLQEVGRLTLLKVRYERGDYRELTAHQKRLLFARWLVEHGRLSES
jgi:hypothetical protein